MKRLFFISLLFLVGVACFAQKEFNIWYFGNRAGLDFNGGTPVALTNSSIYAAEGTAVMSDSTGNILFYTDGIVVWDATHDTMLNGIGLDGGFSSSHAATIVPILDSCDKYYIITTDHQCLSDGLKYSVVDMNLNGGLGDVTSKNIPLYTPIAEKVAVIKHANGIDYWMVAHECSDTFSVYLITSTGISPIPVKTAIGSVHSDAKGQMKFSEDGTKLATVTGDFTGRVDLVDFDISTGVISNAMTFPDTLQYIGLEISPDNTKLYVATGWWSFLYQYDLTAGNEAAIIASKTLVGMSNPAGGAMQLGPDGKIYLSRLNTGYLGVINDPDSLGTACNYVNDGVFLAGKVGRLGLPSFIKGYTTNCPPAEGIQEGDDIEDVVRVYPNPSTGQFTVSSRQGAKVEVYDLFGRLVLETSNKEIDMSSFSKGLYFVKAGETTLKLILQ